jgi:hypothetical protein
MCGNMIQRTLYLCFTSFQSLFIHLFIYLLIYLLVYLVICLFVCLLACLLTLVQESLGLLDREDENNIFV